MMMARVMTNVALFCLGILSPVSTSQRKLGYYNVSRPIETPFSHSSH